MSSPRQKGIALVMALIVTLAAVAIATELGVQQQLSIHRTEALRDNQQILSLLQDLEQTAATAIVADIKAQRHYVEPKPLALPKDSGPARVEATVTDLQQRFNLNDLYFSGQVRVVSLQRLRRLLASLRHDPDLTNAILDWLDHDGQRRAPGGAEDARYSRDSQPYRAANRYFASLRELNLVHGITPRVYEDLNEHTQVLPPGAGINVNTVVPSVLRTIAPNLSEVQLKNFLQLRDDQPFTSPRDLLAIPGIADSENFALEGITTQSRFFGLNAKITLDRRSYRFVSHIESDGEQARVIARFPEES